MNQAPTGAQPTQSYNPVPSNGGYGSGWSHDGKYHLLFTDTVNIYLNNGANANMNRVFNDTPLNVFGEDFYPRTVSWFADDYYFWVSGSGAASINTAGCRKAFLCYYNPVANTITVLDSFTTATDISMLSLSPCNRWIAFRQGSNLLVHRILPNRRPGAKLLSVLLTHSEHSLGTLVVIIWLSVFLSVSEFMESTQGEPQLLVVQFQIDRYLGG